jgi:hypothetical protein
MTLCGLLAVVHWPLVLGYILLATDVANRRFETPIRAAGTLAMVAYLAVTVLQLIFGWPLTSIVAGLVIAFIAFTALITENPTSKMYLRVPLQLIPVTIIFEVLLNTAC